MDGISIEEFDYTWHCDPSSVHEDVKNAPAEYYTGTKPDTDAAAYIDQELFYFPALSESGFQLLNYDGEQEWGYYYTDGVNDDYLFATLPKLGTSLPSQMMHSEEEAAQNRVLHITKAGTYALSGIWNGQIRIDLGDKDETFADENAKVTIILDNAQINCTVAPGIVCYSAYECQNTWEEQESYSSDVDLANAGFRVQLAEGSSNSVSGMNVFRMLKTVYKDEASTDPVKVQKKMRKTDGAFYSYVSMVVESESEDASLQIDSGFEGLDSELYLAINGGTITINSQDDGINVNEDNVSSVMFNGGNITINAALGAEGDGVDSNGYIEINGGTLNINGIRVPDNALDSEDGIYYNGGSVYIDGTLQEYNPGDVLRESGTWALIRLQAGLILPAEKSRLPCRRRILTLRHSANRSINYPRMQHFRMFWPCLAWSNSAPWNAPAISAVKYRPTAKAAKRLRKVKCRASNLPKSHNLLKKEQDIPAFFIIFA